MYAYICVYMYVYIHIHTYYRHGSWILLHSKNQLFQQPWGRLQKAPALQSRQPGLGSWQLLWLLQWAWQGAESSSHSLLPSPAREQRTPANLWKTLLQGAVGAPWSKQLPSHPSRCSCAGPDSEIASPADKLQISLHHTAILLQQRISVYFLCGCFFHFCSRSKDADLAAVLWCVRTWARPGAETGLGTRKCWARVSPPHCHAPLGPASPQGRGNTQLLLWNSVWKWVCSTVKLWQPWPALQASRLCARLVNQVVLNCQIHQTSKEMKLFPWDSFCAPATEMLHQSFPLKSQAARCSGIPSSSSVGLATSAKQGFIFSAVQTNMSQDDCEKALANIIGMIKRRGKNS